MALKIFKMKLLSAYVSKITGLVPYVVVSRMKDDNSGAVSVQVIKAKTPAAAVKFLKDEAEEVVCVLHLANHFLWTSNLDLAESLTGVELKEVPK